MKSSLPPGTIKAAAPDAARHAEVVIVAIPKKNMPDLPKDLIADAAGDVDAGSLSESLRQQRGTPVYFSNLDADGVRHALALASPARQPDWRAIN